MPRYHTTYLRNLPLISMFPGYYSRNQRQRRNETIDTHRKRNHQDIRPYTFEWCDDHTSQLRALHKLPDIGWWAMKRQHIWYSVFENIIPRQSNTSSNSIVSQIWAILEIFPNRLEQFRRSHWNQTRWSRSKHSSLISSIFFFPGIRIRHINRKYKFAQLSDVLTSFWLWTMHVPAQHHGRNRQYKESVWMPNDLSLQIHRVLNCRTTISYSI